MLTLTPLTWSSSSPPTLSLDVLVQVLIPVSLPHCQGPLPLVASGQTILLKPDSELATDAKSVISYCLETLTIRQGVCVQLEAKDLVQKVRGWGRAALRVSQSSLVYCRARHQGMCRENPQWHVGRGHPQEGHVVAA